METTHTAVASKTPIKIVKTTIVQRFNKVAAMDTASTSTVVSVTATTHSRG